MSKARDLANIAGSNAFEDADETKLDGIEASADVTDAANVDPLVDGHLNTSTAASGEFLSWNGTDYDWAAASGGTTGIDDNATSTAVTIDSSGNVGIGTGSPSQKLHVEGAGNQFILLNNSTTNDGFYIKAGTGASSLQTAGGSHLMNFFTSGTERMKIDASGRVTMPYQPAFDVSHTTNAFLSGDIIFNNPYTNVGSHYNTSNGRFTAPIAGNYYFIFAAIVGNSGSFTLAVRKNSSSFEGAVGWCDSGSNDTGIVAKIMSLSAGDYVNAWTSGGNIEAQYASFAGFLIG